MPNLRPFPTLVFAVLTLLAVTACGGEGFTPQNVALLERATALEEVLATPGVVVVDFYADW